MKQSEKGSRKILRIGERRSRETPDPLKRVRIERSEEKNQGHAVTESCAEKKGGREKDGGKRSLSAWRQDEGVSTGVRAQKGATIPVRGQDGAGSGHCKMGKVR